MHMKITGRYQSVKLLLTHTVHCFFPDKPTPDKQFRTLKISRPTIETFRRRPGKRTKRVLFHQDNSPANKIVAAMAALRDCGFELVDHPPCSPDLALSDYFMFPNMEENTWLGSSIGPMRRLYLQLRTFIEDQYESLYNTESKHCNTDGKEQVCRPQGRLKK